MTGQVDFRRSERKKRNKMVKVDSYDQYIQALDGRGDVIVFRGQANSDFVLIPSGLRGDHIATADSQMFRFVDEMKQLFDVDELTCIEIAQHFALPTRMLDFSYSFDVALFFACHDSKGRYMDNDGKVFIFNKSRYEKYLKEEADKRLSSSQKQDLVHMIQMGDKMNAIKRCREWTGLGLREAKDMVEQGLL